MSTVYDQFQLQKATLLQQHHHKIAEKALNKKKQFDNDQRELNTLKLKKWDYLKRYRLSKEAEMLALKLKRKTVVRWVALAALEHSLSTLVFNFKKQLQHRED